MIFDVNLKWWKEEMILEYRENYEYKCNYD